MSAALCCTRTLGRQRITGLGRHAQQNRELRQHRGRHARVRTEGSQHPLTQLGQLIIRLGQQQPTQGAKRLKYAVKLQISPILVELACHKPAIVARHHRAQMVDQCRFADSRRPADQDTAALAPQRVIERFLQRRHLVVAPDEPRRRD